MPRVSSLLDIRNAQQCVRELHPRMKGRPIAPTIKVDGNPYLRCEKNVRSYPYDCAFIACSLTMRFAAEPTKVKLPPIVLAQARNNQALVTLALLSRADAAIRVPKSSTAIPMHMIDVNLSSFDCTRSCKSRMLGLC